MRIHVVGFAIMQPQFSRRFQRSDDIDKCSGQGFYDVGNVVLLAHALDQRSDPEQIVARHGGEQMVLNLEVEMAREPVVEVRLVDVARRT